MFTFTVDPVDGGDRFELTADSRDVLQWERQKAGRSVTKLLLEGASLIDAYSMAYIAAKREGLITCSPREFEETHKLMLGQEPEPDPTPPAR